MTSIDEEKNSPTIFFETYLRVLLLKEYFVTFVTGPQILNVWVRYCHNILPMRNRNITQHGIQITGLGVMIGRCSPDSQHGIKRHPANVGCSFFRYTNDDLSKHINQRYQHRKWIKKDNKLALLCYFRNNPTQRGHSKRMIEIWERCVRFQTINQRLAVQVGKRQAMMVYMNTGLKNSLPSTTD